MRKQAVVGEREMLTRKYAFSSMLRCGFCGRLLTRRCWHSDSKYERVIWQCSQWTKKGKDACPKCKGVAEVIIERAFVEAYNQLYRDNQYVLKEFIGRVSKVISSRAELVTQLELQKELDKAIARRERFVDMRIDNLMTEEAFRQKYKELTDTIDSCAKELAQSQVKQNEFEHFKNRMKDIQDVLASGVLLEKFDRSVFESIVDHIVVGGYDEDGREDPFQLTIVFKTGGNILIDGTHYRPRRMNASKKTTSSVLCEQKPIEAIDLVPLDQYIGSGVRGADGKESNMKNTKNDNLRMFTNSGLAIGSIPLTVLMMGADLLMYHMGGGGFGEMILCGVLAIGWIGACLLAAPKWYANIEFTPEGLIHRAPFRKATLVPYRSLHIYPAYYIHVCVPVPYIVFSTKILSNYELSHINNVPNTSEVIPIEYRRKTYEKLLNVLPREGRAMLRAAFDEKYEQETRK